MVGGWIHSFIEPIVHCNLILIVMMNHSSFDIDINIVV